MTGDGDVTDKRGPAPVGPRARSAVELQRIIEAERAGRPFLLWRDHAGEQQILALGAQLGGVTIGRRPSSSIVLAQDDQVSRTHAQLELVGEDWTIADDGLSRNGTFVNGARITQRRRLSDGDVLRFGKSVVEYRAPKESTAAVTRAGSFVPLVDSLTEAQRKILIALCRPYRAGEQYATPASNNEIGQEVFLGIDAVKNHLRILFQRFGIADLPQNQKRARLVELTFQWGLVTERDF